VSFVEGGRLFSYFGGSAVRGFTVATAILACTFDVTAVTFPPYRTMVTTSNNHPHPTRSEWTTYRSLMVYGSKLCGNVISLLCVFVCVV